MKKGILFAVTILLCVVLMTGTAIAGLTLAGDVTYDMDTQSTGSTTTITPALSLGSLNFTLAWKRVWIPSLTDSLILTATTTIGTIGLKYAKELVDPDAGTFTATLALAPLAFEYVMDFDNDAAGTIKVSFSKAF